MNIKKFLLAAVAVFAFIFFYDGIIHGYVLDKLGFYEETRSITRDFNQAESFIAIMLVFKLALAAWLTYAFTQLFPKGGLTDGLRYGLYFGVFAGLVMAAFYAWLPIPEKLAVSWFVSNIVQGLGYGAILGSLYK